MKEFTFKTKFDLGDTVYFIDCNRKINVAEIYRIDFDVTKDGVSIYYKTMPYNYIREEICYASREELIANL